MTTIDRYTFGDREHVALRMMPCIAPALREESDNHFADPDERSLREGADGRHALLRALHPTGYRDLRAFVEGRPPATSSFHVDDLDSVDRFAGTHRDRNVYVGVAPRSDDKGRDTEACLALHALFTEQDYKDSSEAEARARLAAFPLPPSAVVASGGGLQSYWFLTEPLDVVRSKPLLRGLAIALGADLKAAEPARILRLPGTRNWKYDPPRDVILETFISNRRYPLADFAELGQLNTLPEPALLVRHNVNVRERIQLATAWLAQQPEAVEGNGGDNETFRICAAVARGFDLGDDDAVASLADWNARCKPPWSRFELRQKVRNGREYGTEQIGGRLIEPNQTAFVTYEKGHKKGEIVAEHQGNIRLALARLGLYLSYNAFAAKELATYEGVDKVLDDPVVHRAWLQVDEVFHFRPSIKFFEIVVGDTCRRRSFHPVREYLDGLIWDGEPRINTWLVTYGGAVDPTTQSDADDSLSYLEAVSSIFLIAAVRRIRSPGIKSDELLIAEGVQGSDKSSAAQALCPDPNWFSDDLPLGVDAKQVIERTAGKWIIEASELQGYTNAQVDHLKSMLSQRRRAGATGLRTPVDGSPPAVGADRHDEQDDRVPA